jgi:hypothetical protein
MRRLLLLTVLGINSAFSPGETQVIADDVSAANRREMETIRAELVNLEAAKAAAIHTPITTPTDSSSQSRSLRRGSSYSHRGQSASFRSRSLSNRTVSTRQQQLPVTSGHDKLLYGGLGAIFGAVALGAYRHFR